MDAFAHLGLRNDADERAVKRAYAQRLKQVRPDVDPVGFQQLHEAYQAALAAVRWRASMDDVADVAIDDVSASPPSSEPALQSSLANEAPSLDADGQAPCADPLALNANAPPVDQHDPLIETLTPPPFDFDAFYAEMLGTSCWTDAEGLRGWLVANPAFWSLQMKARVGAITLDHMFAEPPEVTPAQFDVLLAFFGYDDVLVQRDPLALQTLRAHLQSGDDARRSRDQIVYELQPEHVTALISRMQMPERGGYSPFQTRILMRSLRKRFAYWRVFLLALVPLVPSMMSKFMNHLANGRLDVLTPSIDARHIAFWQSFQPGSSNRTRTRIATVRIFVCFASMVSLGVALQVGIDPNTRWRIPVRGPEGSANALLQRGLEYRRLGQLEQALPIYRELLAKYEQAPEPQVREIVAKAMLETANTFGKLGQNGEEIAGYDSVVARFGGSTEPPIRELVAMAMYNKGYQHKERGRLTQAVEAFDDVINRFATTSEEPTREWVARSLLHKALCLGALERREEAMAVYTDLTSRFDSMATTSSRQRFYLARFNTGAYLTLLGRHEEAIAEFNKLISRMEIAEGAVDTRASEWIADGLIAKGNVLVSLNRKQEAVEVYGEVLTRFASPKSASSKKAIKLDSTVNRHIARAQFNIGMTLGELGRNEEAVAAYDDVVVRFGEATETVLRENVANALVYKAAILAQLGRRDEAMAIYEQVTARFGSRLAEPAARRHAVRAELNRASLLSGLGRHAEALTIYDGLLVQYGSSTEPDGREVVADALFAKGYALAKLERRLEAIVAYSDLITRFSQSNEARLREIVGLAMVNRGYSLGKLGRRAEELEDYDALLARIAAATEPGLVRALIYTLVNKGEALSALGRDQDAVATFDDFLARFGKPNDTLLPGLIANGLFSKGLAFDALGRKAEAVQVWETLLSRFGSTTEPPIGEWVAKALLHKGQALIARERRAEAAVVFDDLIARFGSATEDPLRDVVAKARLLQSDHK